MTAKHSFDAITRSHYPRAIAALLAATLAVLVDLIVRSSAYWDLFLLLPAGGIMTTTLNEEAT